MQNEAIMSVLHTPAISAASVIRCSRCGKSTDDLSCSCGWSAAVRDGIITLPSAGMHAESERELAVREQQYQMDGTAAPDPLDLAEMVPHIEALRLSGSESLLEIGAGSGRYTAQLASRCSSIVAVDFSREGLTQIARCLAGQPHVIPVQADIADLRVAP